MRRTEINIPRGFYMDTRSDPPDEPCVVCGKEIPGHHVSFMRDKNNLMLCLSCNRPIGMPSGFPNFRESRGWRQTWMVPMMQYQDAGAILWTLEQEIDNRRKSDHTNAE